MEKCYVLRSDKYMWVKRLCLYEDIGKMLWEKWYWSWVLKYVFSFNK